MGFARTFLRASTFLVVLSACANGQFPFGSQPTNPFGSQPAGPFGSQFGSPFGSIFRSQPRGTLGSESSPFRSQTSNPFGSQPANTFGSQPAGPFGSQPASPFASQPSNPFGSQSNGPFGSRPTNPFRSQPDNIFRSQPSNPFDSQSTGPFASQPSNPFRSQPDNIFRSQPSNLFQSQPTAPFGSQPGNPFGSQRTNPFVLQPSNQFGSQPANQFGSHPVNLFRSPPTNRFRPQPVNQFGSQPANQFALQPSSNQFGSQPVNQLGPKPTNQFVPQPVNRPVSKPTDRLEPQSSNIFESQPTNPQSSELLPTSPPSIASSDSSPNSTSLSTSSPDSVDSVSSPPETPNSVSNPHISPGSSPQTSASSKRPASVSPSKSLSKPSKDVLNGYRIVCIFNNKHFFRGEGFRPSFIDPSLCTHINYEFAILDPKAYEMITGEPDLDVEEGFYEEAIALKMLNPRLKVMLGLGGWEDSTEKYSKLAADKDKRENFIQEAIKFLKIREFDGLDFAWEYPNCWQGALGAEPNDKANFVTLLREMKSEFEKNDLLLSVSVGALKREVDAAYDVKAISDTVDYINVMTYDMHGPWETKTGHHTQFETIPGDVDPYNNVKSAMDLWIGKGAVKSKLNAGIAMYGKTFTLADPNDNRLGAPATGVGDPGPDSDQAGFLLYNEICKYLNSGNWTEKEDKKAGFYAYSGDQWTCYDPPVMMVRKAKYVVDHGLGGVLLKDLSGDDFMGYCFSMPFPLLKMVKLEMIHRVKAKERAARRHHH